MSVTPSRVPSSMSRIRKSSPAQRLARTARVQIGRRSNPTASAAPTRPTSPFVSVDGAVNMPIAMPKTVATASTMKKLPLCAISRSEDVVAITGPPEAAVARCGP